MGPPYISMSLASDCLLDLPGPLRSSSFESSAAFFPLRGERSLSFSSLPAARSGERASDCVAVGGILMNWRRMSASVKATPDLDTETTSDSFGSVYAGAAVVATPTWYCCWLRC